MLQLMRNRRKAASGKQSCDSGGPVVVVTNWQHAANYPPEWVVQFKEVVKRSLDPSPIFIETYGTDEQTEDQLMEVIEQVKQSTDEMHVTQFVGGGGDKLSLGGKSLSTSSLVDDEDVALLDSPVRTKPSALSLRWRSVRQHWPLALVAVLFLLLVVFRHFLAPLPPEGDNVDVVDALGINSSVNSSSGAIEYGPVNVPVAPEGSGTEGDRSHGGGYSTAGFAGDYQPRPPETDYQPRPPEMMVNT